MSYADKFMSLFSGLKRAYGTYVVKEKKGDKQVGDALTKLEPVTELLWQKHLSGEKSLGIVPISEESTCSFGAVDVDSYVDFNIVELSNKIDKLGLPLAVCRSKSGGAHCYLFASEPVPAQLMRDRLQDMASILGYGQSELFPKQSVINSERGDVGNWINMPYFGGLKGLRYCPKPDGDAMTEDEFLVHALNRSMNAEWFEKPVQASVTSAFKLIEGPPCLERLVQIQLGEGTRNDGMYNVGVYLKKAYPNSDLLEKMVEHNLHFCDPPMSLDELQGLVKSLSRKEWNYTCSKRPISLYCNPGLCRTRANGVGKGSSSNSGFPKLGPLRKLTTSPPVWFWDVSKDEGQTYQSIELTTEELQSPKMFQKCCLEQASYMPVIASQTVWQQVVEICLANLTVIEVPKEASEEGLFWELLEKFCTGRAQAQSKEEVLLDKPWTSEGRTWFRSGALMSFLERSHFKAFGISEVAKIFKTRDVSVEHDRWVLKGKKVNVWGVPSFSKPDSDFSVPSGIEKKTPF